MHDAYYKTLYANGQVIKRETKRQQMLNIWCLPIFKKKNFVCTCVCVHTYCLTYTQAFLISSKYCICICFAAFSSCNSLPEIAPCVTCRIMVTVQFFVFRKFTILNVANQPSDKWALQKGQLLDVLGKIHVHVWEGLWVCDEVRDQLSATNVEKVSMVQSCQESSLMKLL